MKLLKSFPIILFAALSLGACTSSTPSTIQNTPNSVSDTPISENAAQTPASNNSFPTCVDTGKKSSAQVIEVLDGDTIVAIVDGKKVHIRYIGIDAPEKDLSPHLSELATEANATLLKEGMVTLYADIENLDDYGRQLRYVFAGDVFVNLQLTSLGLAEANQYPPNTSCNSVLETAESEAREADLGIWKTASQNPSQGVARIVELNKVEEFVIIRNLGSGRLELDGWILASERGNQNCPLRGVLAPGEDLIIHSQSGTGGLNCGLLEPMWSNTQSDPASLYDPDGNLIDRWEDE